MRMRLEKNATIDDHRRRQIEMETEKLEAVLQRLLDIVKYLAKQNQAFRGHFEQQKYDSDFGGDSSRGNFLELVHLVAKYDPVLREHLVRVQLSKSRQLTYLSNRTQNKFIEKLGERVRQKIIERVKTAKYFTMIFDSTPDLSHKDQTSQVLRYVILDGKEVKVTESFVGFIETEKKDAAGITSMILQSLEKDGLDIQHCRGQAYDNAAVMSGHRSGVQKRIRDINPGAEFVACSNHSLNLAGVHAASASVRSVSFFGVIEKLFCFFSSSTHRWSALTAVAGSLKRLIETRWSARGDAVGSVKKHYLGIIGVLEKLTTEVENAATRGDAAVLLGALQTHHFLVFLNLWDPVLREINSTQCYLQTKGLDLHQCDLRLRALEFFLTQNRDTLVEEALTMAEKTCGELEIPLSKPTRRNDASLSYSQEIRRDMYASMDRITQEVKSRFNQIHSIAEKYEFLIPRNLLNADYLCTLEEHSKDIDLELFVFERVRLQTLVASADDEEQAQIRTKGPFELLQFIQRYALGSSLPNIVVLLRIFLTLAISVASCERSFSKLKLIKNHLRSTMGASRLNSLAILSIEHKLTDEIDFEDVIQEFAENYARYSSNDRRLI
ncbi:zinc finger MYM-type protein 1-like [Galendromus occidentalis]|uniref:Zinc finger MYM-type protein 1-like n=1 Tax=Galendromus occidentalis TaxID=34638 RepID=A0AAJ7P9E7_9ACAR|nr:zinc finger MYM-type protein 1-like [Galendromus occidentalis]